MSVFRMFTTCPPLRTVQEEDESSQALDPHVA